MDPTRFYGRRTTQVREIPDGSDDSELSAEEDDADLDETWQPGSDNHSDDSESDVSESSMHADGRSAIPAQGGPDDQGAAPNRNNVWQQRNSRDFLTRQHVFTGQVRQGEDPKEPVQYFRNMISDDILNNLVTQSNRYSVQQDVTKPLSLTRDELEQFFGIVFLMSIVKMPRTRYYWSPATRYAKIADVMQLRRFEEIKSKLHCNDNLERPDQCTDKLYKLRPLINAFKEIVNAETKSEKLSIDEQIVPFKGKSSLKQYNPKKPKKWGYKIFVCSGVSGLVHDFEIYTGRIEKCPNQHDVGASGNIVLRLLQTVPRDVWHTVYFDNWFTSPILQVTLFKQGIATVGTVRINRVKGCKMPTDKELSKNGRGAAVMKTAVIDDVELIATKWMDNKSVTLLSTYAGIEPSTDVKRWDRKQQKEILVSCPSVVSEYNKFIGGVDLLDALLALYRNPIRSKKWYHRILFHILDMAVVQAWLIYRSDCEQAGVERRNILALLGFKLQVAERLLKENKTEPRKRGRPSLEMETRLLLKKTRGPTSHVPPFAIRTDNLGHFPVPVNDKERCKNPGCTGYARITCEKCRLHLCLTQKSNCFKLKQSAMNCVLYSALCSALCSAISTATSCKAWSPAMKMCE